MRRMLVLLILFATTNPLFAQRLSPESVKVKAGELIIIATSAKGEVGFFWDAREFGPKHAKQDGKTLYLTTGKSGLYSINVVCWDDKRIEQVLVEVEGGVVPTPIDPPLPTPSDLLKKLQSAWAKESSEDKAKIKAYQQLYLEMADKTPSFKKTADLWVELSKARPVRLGDTVSRQYLRSVGSVFGDDLNTFPELKNLEGALSDALRATLATRFKQYAAAMGELK